MGSTATNMDGAHVGMIERSSFNIASRDLIRIEHRYDNCTIGAASGHADALGVTNESGERRRESRSRGCWSKLKMFLSSMRISHPNQISRRARELFTITLSTNQLVDMSGEAMSMPFPSTSNMPIPETYSQLMSAAGHGYALYQPGLNHHLPIEYRMKGIRVGDVGVINQDGGFDFLFNVCASQSVINPPELPSNFEMLQSVITSDDQYFSHATHLLSLGVDQKRGDLALSYCCSAAQGAVLKLPRGATLFKALNTLALRELAESWYQYMIVNKAIDAHNGSLCIITACVKCYDWGIAYFDRPSTSDDYLQFVMADSSTSLHDQTARPPFHWRGSGPVLTKVSPSTQNATVTHGEPNQCIFLRGYQVVVPSEVWASIMRTRGSR